MRTNGDARGNVSLAEVSPTRPPRLRPGDRVAVVAPSGPVDADRLEAGRTALRDLGLDVIVGEHALDQDTAGGPPPRPPGGAAPGGRPPHVPPGLGYLAGNDVDRAADLRDAWCDPDVAAVLCARGGYGAARVLDHLDWSALRAAAPKTLHGSSDITALHVAFGSRLSSTTSFGPMVASLLADPEPDRVSMDHLRSALFGGKRRVTGTRALVGGRAHGPLTGGNLSLLVSLLGTPYAPEPAAGRIVVLEDVNEAPYRIDRMLTQLLQAGWFGGEGWWGRHPYRVAGVVLGGWTGCGPTERVEAVLTDRLAPLGVPILAGVPLGHGPRQLTVELGGAAFLDADAHELVQEPT